MGLEIAGDFEGSADGFVSYVDISAPVPVVRRKYFSVVYNDQSIFQPKFRDEVNPSFFNKFISNLLKKLNEVKFVEESIVFGIKFYYRKEKSIPAVSATFYQCQDRQELMVEGSAPAFTKYKNTAPPAKQAPVAKVPDENKPKKHHKKFKHRPNHQKPANENKPTIAPEPVVDDTPPQPASSESLTLLSERFSVKQ